MGKLTKYYYIKLQCRKKCTYWHTKISAGTHVRTQFSTSKTLFFFLQTSLLLDTAYAQMSYKCQAKKKVRAWWILQEEKIGRQVVEAKWEKESKKVSEKINWEKRVLSVTEHLSANITNLYNRILVTAHWSLLAPVLQVTDSELALQETYQGYFAYSIILELVLWYLFLQQEFHTLDIFWSQVLCNSI